MYAVRDTMNVEEHFDSGSYYRNLNDPNAKIDIIRRSVYPIVGHFSKPGYCYAPYDITEDVYEEMRMNPSITEFTIVENNVPVGFMTKAALNETLGGRYGFTLHSKNPIKDIMKTDFLRVDCIMPVDEVSKLAMQRPFERLYNPIVVEHEGKYSGVVTVKDLLETGMMLAMAERDEIAVMKDSLKIGLFLMDRNYIIQDHYSRYLEEILMEENLYGRNFPELLSASVSAKELDTVRDYFQMVFSGAFDQDVLDDINPLNELHYVCIKTGKRKVFQCGFFIIEKNRGEVFTLASIYDITAKYDLQQQLMEEENKRQEEMKSVFELIQVEPQVFNDFLDDAEYEFEKIDEIIKNETLSPHKALVETYQSIHAIKSNAVILGLSTFGGKAHNLESKIKKLRELEEAPFNAMLELAADIENLSGEKDGLKTTVEKLNTFKVNNIGNSLNQKQHVLIESLARAVNKASSDMGKKVQFKIGKIDDEAIENGPRRVIKEVLMQLIRNSVVHGIETPEERIVNGKDENGVIRLSIKMNDGNVQVKLGDDGKGFDYEKIAQKALRLNLIKKEDAKDKNVLLKIIFSPGFSTAETEGVHAGRGIGLSLVMDRIRGAKGSIKVKSEKGSGAIFKILFPILAQDGK
jgi:two-component system chemotaxis sensor kinase CheA